MSSCDAITVFTSIDGKPINKFAKRGPDGKVAKGYIPHKQSYWAETRTVPDLAAMADLLREVGERPDQSIGLFIFDDPPASRWQSWSAGRLARELGLDKDKDREKLAGWHDFGDGPVVARIKENQQRSSWHLFDRDDAKEMPDELRVLTFPEWVEAVDLLVPGFAACGKVVLPSTSTRVLVDGVPLDSISRHVYAQMADVDCFADPWHDAYERSATTFYEPMLGEDPVRLAFGKPRHCRMTGNVLGKQLWSIYDQSTWAVNRLAFDGKPTVYGDLNVGPPVVQTFGSGRLDWSKFKSISQKEKKEIDEATREITGLVRTRERTYSTSRTGKQVVSGVRYVVPILTMNLEVETGTGEITTVGKLHESGETHVRLQSPFRQSRSQAAYFGLHRDNSPFIYDSGTNEKYVLDAEKLERAWEKILQWLGDDYQPRFRTKDGGFFSETFGTIITLPKLTPTPEIIDALALTVEAPRDPKTHSIKRGQLPAFFNSWKQVAYGRLIRDLPLEEEADVTSPEAKEEFDRQLARLLTTMVSTSWGAQGMVERHSIGAWAYRFAGVHTGEWNRVSSYDLWGKRDKAGGFEVAFLPTLADQLRVCPEIAGMSLNKLTRKCRRYGVHADGDNRIVADGDRFRTVILSREFVSRLKLSNEFPDPLAHRVADVMKSHSPLRGGAVLALIKGVGRMSDSLTYRPHSVRPSVPRGQKLGQYARATYSE